MRASITLLHLLLVWLNHQAIGVPIIIKITIVVNDNLMVSANATKSGLLSIAELIPGLYPAAARFQISMIPQDLWHFGAG